MIKGIQGHGYYDELVIPIIENTAHERELTESLSQAVYLPLMSLFIFQHHHRGSAFLFVLLVISISEHDLLYCSIPLGMSGMYRSNRGPIQAIHQYAPMYHVLVYSVQFGLYR